MGLPTEVLNHLANARTIRAVLLPLVADARSAGPLPQLGSPEWVAAEPRARYAAAFAELLRYLEAATLRCLVSARDRREAPYKAQREASYAVAAALDWSEQSHRPTHAELVRRRTVVTTP